MTSLDKGEVGSGPVDDVGGGKGTNLKRIKWIIKLNQQLTWLNSMWRQTRSLAIILKSTVHCTA